MKTKSRLLLLYLLCSMCMQAQRRTDCGTKAPLIKPVLTAEMRQRAETQRTMYTAPFPIRVFFRVFANDDGSNVAATEDDIKRQFGNMRSFFLPHNICFLLTGIEVIRNSDLNNMNTDELNDRAQVTGLAASNAITIFVHSILFDNDGNLNGSAYSIPNHFLSLVAGAVSSTTNLSTMAHEMGHCLGLLHTFETGYGMEAVARNGDCRDCEDEGDLLCDTNADLNVDDDLINAACVYIGNAQDECNFSYLMEEKNIMTYGERSCRDHFTGGQGTRALFYMITTHENRIAEDALSLGNASISNGLFIYAARNAITFTASSFVVSGGAAVNFSANAITFTEGVDLRPSTGVVSARVGTYCQ